MTDQDDPDEGVEWIRQVAGRQWQEADLVQSGIEIVIRLTDRVDEQRDKIRELTGAVAATRDVMERQQALINRLAARLQIAPEDAT